MRKLFISVLIIVVIIAVFLFIRNRNKENSKQLEYETTEVVKGVIDVKVISIGTIQPYTRVEIRSPVRGRIDSIRVDEGDVVKKGQVLAWISSEDRISLLDAALSALASAQKKNDKEAIKAAEEAYEVALKAYKPVPVITSISGEVIKRSCEPGQNVTLDSVLFVLSDRLVARVEVDEADIGKIGLGQEAIITLDAFPGELVKAKVTKISREGRTVSEVVIYDVMVEPPSVPGYWASGMTATVKFSIEQKNNILIIPKSAIQEKRGAKIVFVLAEKPSPREIETGISDGKMVEVLHGLNEGDKIILNFKGNDNTSPSSRQSIRMLRMMR